MRLGENPVRGGLFSLPTSKSKMPVDMKPFVHKDYHTCIRQHFAKLEVIISQRKWCCFFFLKKAKDGDACDISRKPHTNLKQPYPVWWNYKVWDWKLGSVLSRHKLASPWISYLFCMHAIPIYSNGHIHTYPIATLKYMRKSRCLLSGSHQPLLKSQLSLQKLLFLSVHIIQLDNLATLAPWVGYDYLVTRILLIS